MIIVEMFSFFWCCFFYLLSGSFYSLRFMFLPRLFCMKKLYLNKIYFVRYFFVIHCCVPFTLWTIFENARARDTQSCWWHTMVVSCLALTENFELYQNVPCILYALSVHVARLVTYRLNFRFFFIFYTIYIIVVKKQATAAFNK